MPPSRPPAQRPLRLLTAAAVFLLCLVLAPLGTLTARADGPVQHPGGRVWSQDLLQQGERAFVTRATGRGARQTTRAARFPDARTTGAPPRRRLSAYVGPCTITRPGTVIRRRVVSCDLDVRAADVTILRSLVRGTVSTGTEPRTGYSVRIEHSTVDVSPGSARMVTGVEAVHVRVVASEVRGGNRGINCWYDCVVRRSWVHGQDTDPTGVWHESGIRMGQRARIVANTIACDAPEVPPDAGCSAPLTGYGDFGPVRDNRIERNLFVATTGGVCAYGGSSGGKPYSDDAENVRFIDNVFERGDTGNCGYWAPILDFDESAPGNEWAGNAWSDGGRISP